MQRKVATGLAALPLSIPTASIRQHMRNLTSHTSRVIPLDELPRWSPWPGRLLQLTEWAGRDRTVAQVEKEYNQDKYLRCLEFLKSNPGATCDDVRAFELTVATPSICVSQKNILYELPAKNIMPVNTMALLDTLSPLVETADIVVELGCGYGHNLWELRKNFPNKKFFGGEYSENAVALSAMLYKDCPNLTVEPFNFYDDTYPILERCAPGKNVLLFTRHAIEQLPTALKVFTTLTKYFDRLQTVVHMEVALENFGESLLDLLRKRYVEVNDYNRDIVGLLKSRSDITLVRNDPDEFGLNPFNPSSVLVWTPRR